MEKLKEIILFLKKKTCIGLIISLFSPICLNAFGRRFNFSITVLKFLRPMKVVVKTEVRISFDFKATQVNIIMGLSTQSYIYLTKMQQFLCSFIAFYET